METLALWVPICFFLVALFYSIVGFGGGSSYLAILVIGGMPYQNIAPVALVCNLIVTSGGCWHFYRGGHFKLKNVLPFIVLSIPMAYVGGRLMIGKEVFGWLLGLSLFAVAIRMLLPNRTFEHGKEISWQKAWLFGLPIGALLGFLAGVVGIGGGIFLSPLLLLLKWVNVKEAAATASFFIMVNSASGLMGQLQKGAVDFHVGTGNIELHLLAQLSRRRIIYDHATVTSDIVGHLFHDLTGRIGTPRVLHAAGG